MRLLFLFSFIFFFIGCNKDQDRDNRQAILNQFKLTTANGSLFSENGSVYLTLIDDYGRLSIDVSSDMAECIFEVTSQTTQVVTKRGLIRLIFQDSSKRFHPENNSYCLKIKELWAVQGFLIGDIEVPITNVTKSSATIGPIERCYLWQCTKFSDHFSLFSEQASQNASIIFGDDYNLFVQ